MNHNEKLFQGMTWIEDSLVEEAWEEERARRPRASRWLALAACICLVAGAVLAFRRPAATPGGQAGSGTAAGASLQTEEGVVIPPLEPSLADDQLADMIRFFLYQGRWYVDSGWLARDADVIGERLGTATGLIDEWTPADGYVELAGSVQGDFYSVRGMDPSFMLCQRDPSGGILLYVNDNGITLNRGADLVTQRLHLPETYAGMEYQAYEDWYEGTDRVRTLKPELEEEAQAFLKTLQEGTFVARTGGEMESWENLHHVFLLQDSGLQTHIALFTDGTDGYVFWYGFSSVFLKVDGKALQAFDALLTREDSGIPQKPENPAPALEDCRSDPTLGRYLPEYLPQHFAFRSGTVRYEIDPETGAVGPAEQIHLELMNPDSSSVYGALDVYAAGKMPLEEGTIPILEREELTQEQIGEAMGGPNRFGDVLGADCLDLGVRVGNVVVVLQSAGLSAEDCFAILDSVPLED